MILVFRERLDLEGFQVYLVYLDLVACLDPRETEDHRETLVDLVWVRRDLLDLKDLMDFLDLLVLENQDLRDSVVLLENKVRKCLIVFAACSVWCLHDVFQEYKDIQVQEVCKDSQEPVT